MAQTVDLKLLEDLFAFLTGATAPDYVGDVVLENDDYAGEICLTAKSDTGPVELVVRVSLFDQDTLW